jgi:hypothetical protein
MNKKHSSFVRCEWCNVYVSKQDRKAILIKGEGNDKLDKKVILHSDCKAKYIKAYSAIAGRIGTH